MSSNDPILIFSQKEEWRMASLTIHTDGRTRQISFNAPQPLSLVLEQAGILPAHPCGGRGTCGKCAVTLSGCVSTPNALEQRAGVRLSCQAVILGDAEVVLHSKPENMRIETGGSYESSSLSPLGETLGAAVDIGTTTVALRLFDLSDGRPISEAAALNPQALYGADVIGRISAALSGQGEQLKALIAACIKTLLDEACARASRSRKDVDALVITGNTTMLYLLTGKNPESLSHAPFEADCLFGQMHEQDGMKIYLPPCMNAFVGADITCAALASGLCAESSTALLCDVGTNGEIALFKDGKLYVTSTAAGPAFEGAGISCGMGSAAGAIDAVSIVNGMLRVHTIEDRPAVGVCGSGLIDAVNAFLDLGLIDETGYVDADNGVLSLTNSVCLTAEDIRAVQLCKAAIAAGIDTLLSVTHTRPSDIKRVYLAGGFGSHLNLMSAAGIGLLPRALIPRVKVVGNAALSGASRILLADDDMHDARRIAAMSSHIELGGNPTFNALYMEHMMFPERD